MAMKKFLYFVIAALGFGTVSCEESGIRGGNLDAYGCPHVDYRITARVVDEDGNPIKGIKVTDVYDSHIVDTDDNGEIYIKREQSHSKPDTLKFIDIDGEENGGEFESKTLIIKDAYETIQEPQGWFKGEYEANLGDVILERVEQKG